MKNNHFPFNIITIILLCVYSIIGYSQPVTWVKVIGDPVKSMSGVSVVQTYDGGYAVLAGKGAVSDDLKMILLKLDYQGNLLWLKYPADTIINIRPIKLIQTNDSGFVILGHQYQNVFFLLKTDKNGNFLWKEYYPDTAIYAYFSNFTKTNDNGFILCGDCMISDPPYQVGYVLKTDSAGNVQWRRKYIDTTFSEFLDILQFPDNNYYLAEKLNDQFWAHSFIRKIDSTGKTIWLNFIADSAAACYLTKVQNDKISILSSIYPNRYKISLMDTVGNFYWHNNFDFPHIPISLNSNSSGCSVISGSDMLNNSIGINKLSFGGSSIFTKTLQYTGFEHIGTRGSAVTIDNGFVFTGNADINNKSSILVIKTDSLFNAPVITNILSNSQLISSNFQLFQNYPNPFNSYTLIKFNIPENGFLKIKIFDVSGKEVLNFNNQFYIKGLYSFLFSPDKYFLCSGIYFLRLEYNGQIRGNKLVYLK